MYAYLDKERSYYKAEGIPSTKQVVFFYIWFDRATIIAKMKKWIATCLGNKNFSIWQRNKRLRKVFPREK